MRYYFLGIAGTAMASVAVLLKKKGHEVWGSDAGIYPPMSDFLQEHEIPVWEGFTEEHLETPFDVVVIGNAMSRGNPEVETILNRRLPFKSLPELIREEFIRSHHNIVITGTHGKTTTTSLMAWVLEVAGLSPSFMIGGIAKNFDSSIQLGSGKYFVVEGDEYDCAFFDKRPKFVHYFPDHLIINNIEFDHADIYRDLEAIQDVFKKLLRIIPQRGMVVANADSPALLEILDPVYSRLNTFGQSPQNHWSYRIKEELPQYTVFEIREDGTSVGPEFRFPFPGEFQLQNVLAVVAVAKDLGISWDVIRDALERFQGVKRRMEYWGKFHGAEVYDDFAHHPTAIGATLAAVKKKFPDRRLIALFEPRTNTTVRRFFQQELTDALKPADVVLMTPIHRADRLPENDRLSLPQLASDLEAAGKSVSILDSYADVLGKLTDAAGEGDIVILLTNGSLGGQYQKLRDLVQ